MKETNDKLETEKNVLKAKLDVSLDLDTFHKVKQDKHKLQKELTDKDARFSELERKLKEAEDKCKKLVRDRLIGRATNFKTGEESPSNGTKLVASKEKKKKKGHGMKNEHCTAIHLHTFQ